MSNKVNISRTLIKFISSQTHTHFKTAVGQALTVVDAISENETKRKASKNLIEQALWKQEKLLQRALLVIGDDLATKLSEKPMRSTLSPIYPNIFEDPEQIVTD